MPILIHMLRNAFQLTISNPRKYVPMRLQIQSNICGFVLGACKNIFVNKYGDRVLINVWCLLANVDKYEAK